MKHVRFLMLMLFVVPPAVLAQSPKKDWVPLFNGKDLAGWKNYGAEKRMRFKDLYIREID